MGKEKDLKPRINTDNADKTNFLRILVNEKSVLIGVNQCRLTG